MSLGHGADGNLRVQGREGALGNARERDFALPSPTVFGRSWRSDHAKTGPSDDTEVVDEAKFPHNTGKIGSPKNKLPLPAPRILRRFNPLSGRREFKETPSWFENSFCVIHKSLYASPDTLAYFFDVIIIRNKRWGNPDCRKGVAQAVRAKTCT